MRVAGVSLLTAFCIFLDTNNYIYIYIYMTEFSESDRWCRVDIVVPISRYQLTFASAGEFLVGL